MENLIQTLTNPQTYLDAGQWLAGHWMYVTNALLLALLWLRREGKAAIEGVAGRIANSLRQHPDGWRPVGDLGDALEHPSTGYKVALCTDGTASLQKPRVASLSRRARRDLTAALNFALGKRLETPAAAVSQDMIQVAVQRAVASLQGSTGMGAGKPKA